MNPQAVEWLEGLSEEEHMQMFLPALPCVSRVSGSTLFTVKEDHELCGLCPRTVSA